jgi:hypothetical protein
MRQWPPVTKEDVQWSQYREESLRQDIIPLYKIKSHVIQKLHPATRTGAAAGKKKIK